MCLAIHNVDTVHYSIVSIQLTAQHQITLTMPERCSNTEKRISSRVSLSRGWSGSVDPEHSVTMGIGNPISDALVSIR